MDHGDGHGVRHPNLARVGRPDAAHDRDRPLASRLGAWSSPQSKVISSRQILEAKLDQMKRKFADGEVPLPDNWGGYRIVPETFEFWQGGGGRLHDRFMYRRNADNLWSIERLAP